MFRRTALLLALSPGIARAQPAQRGSVTPGQGRPDPSAQRRAELDRLFEALKDAPDAPGAQLVEGRIRAVWAQAVSPAAGLLLRRGVRNLNGNSADEALEDFDAALILEPGAADLWLMRARAYAQLGDRAGAARDLREALRLEPRHFGAMLQLSDLLDEAGDAAGALRMLDAVLALHPRLNSGEQRRRELQRKAEGDAL
jgi:tetratricopeptide (TPR) repeat protein